MLSISPRSRQYVRVPVTATVNGAAYDPTNDQVQFAFSTVGQPPGTWVNGSWEATLTGQFLARCLVGPGGVVTLTTGEYTVWLRITDNPEQPELNTGQLEVTA